VRVAVDGVGQGALSVGAGAFEQRALSVRCAGHLARVEIFPEPTLVPATVQPGSRDWRTLGVAVTSMRLEGGS
jgi:hypothetical protein